MIGHDSLSLIDQLIGETDGIQSATTHEKLIDVYPEFDPVVWTLDG